MKEAIVIETMFQEVPFEQRFEKIRAAGYKYTELWNLNGKDPEAVRRLADQSGVSIIGLSGDISGRPGDPGMADASRCDEYIALVKECMCCSCCDGVGGEQFEKIMTGGTPEQIENGLSAIPPKETLAEQWNAQIYVRALRRHPVILVSTWLDADTVRRANMIPATDVNEALQIAYGIKGADASVVVIPDGVAVLPE
ncbi:MAG TPA: hypothetical protein H9773_08900 [Candidatus Fournierella merdavium]|nr:hypothetical protein [Candidatus Fournierella merdavium]